MCIATAIQPWMEFRLNEPKSFHQAAHTTATSLADQKITPVVNNVTAKIASVKQDWGWVAYTVRDEFHQQTMIKNGASALPQNNGKVFFHKRNLFSCCLDRLESGMTVTFDVVHNKKSNKYIADCLKIVNEKAKTESEAIKINVSSPINLSINALKNSAAEITRRLSKNALSEDNSIGISIEKSPVSSPGNDFQAKIGSPMLSQSPIVTAGFSEGFSNKGI